ncbi:MAG: 3-oxoacyl-[acyl-carrier-protein] synthase III C-terminal domain-containing protein, partial [Parvularculaceae bacterium]
LSGEPDGGPGPQRGVIRSLLRADGRLADNLYADGGPSTTGTVGKVRMNGREVFRHAVDKISSSVLDIVRLADLDCGAVDWFVPHQANIRIIEACARKLEIGMEKVIVTIERHGNTSSASIPLALDEAIRDGRIKRGQLLAFASLGGGFAWGSALVRY